MNCQDIAHSNYLILDPPVEEDDNVSLLAISPSSDILIKINDRLISSHLEYKSISKNDVKLDWENSISILLSEMQNAQISELIINKIHLELIENYQRVIEYISALNHNDISISRKDIINKNEAHDQPVNNNDTYDTYDTSKILNSLKPYSEIRVVLDAKDQLSASLNPSS